MDKTEFLNQAKELGLHRVAAPISAVLTDCIRIYSSPRSDPLINIGTSKIGGDPDLPDNFDWPFWNDVGLSFLLQIDLSDLVTFSPAQALPKRGLLSFFYHPDQATWGFDPNDRGSWHIYYFPQDTHLHRSPTPPLNSQYMDRPYDSCATTFEMTTSFPSPFSDFIRELDLTEQEWDDYADFYHSLAHDKPKHQLFGDPDIIQDQMELECQLVSNGIYMGDSEWQKHPKLTELSEGAKEWLLLLQLDSDDNANMMWGDLGMLYFWIKEASLKSGHFSDAWMMLQCT